MKERFLQNLDLLKKNHVNVDEHDACGVGFVVSMNGKPKREVILNGINALKAVWHRGAVDERRPNTLRWYDFFTKE